jgi:RNA polymerase sigma factor (sigma-70 family)
MLTFANQTYFLLLSGQFKGFREMNPKKYFFCLPGNLPPPSCIYTIRQSKRLIRKLPCVKEPELITALRKGDFKAQKHLYEQYAPVMLGVCLRYLKNHLDAEEALINGFMKVYTNIGQFEGKGSFEGWVRRIMVNEALGMLRKKEPLHLALDKGHLDLATQATADTDLGLEELLQLVHELPAGYRAVFNLYAIEGFSHKEISDLLQITEGTSKSQLSKARALLQRRLTKQEVDQN